MKVTVSMITLNEERAVAKVVEDIRRVVPGAEIFLVDSSSDRTAEIAQQLGCRVFRRCFGGRSASERRAGMGEPGDPRRPKNVTKRTARSGFRTASRY